MEKGCGRMAAALTSGDHLVISCSWGSCPAKLNRFSMPFQGNRRTGLERNTLFHSYSIRQSRGPL